MVSKKILLVPVGFIIIIHSVLTDLSSTILPCVFPAMCWMINLLLEITGGICCEGLRKL